MSRRSYALACRGIALSTLALLGGGCAAVRPVELRPSHAAPPGYVAEIPPPPPAQPEGAAAPNGPEDHPAPEGGAPSTPAPPAGVALKEGMWWTGFADPALDAAIDEAIHHNYFIRDIRNLIYENQLVPEIPQGPLWPLRIGIPAAVQHVTAALPPGGGVGVSYFGYDLADVGITATYEVDVWGQLDARRRTMLDLVEQQRQSTEAFAQTLADQVTQIWFQILEERALRVLLETQVKYSQDLLEIVKVRFEQHLTPRLVVLQQEQLLLNQQAQVPLVVAQLALLNSKLTALLGRTPRPDVDLVPQSRTLPDLPPAPAVGVPGDLVRNVPELRFAQSRVAEAEHQKSENLASWLPTVEAFANADAQSFNFDKAWVVGAVGARLTWPIFDGGQRIKQAKQLELTIQRRNWQYDMAFDGALQRVQDAMIQEQRQADNLRALRAQVELGRRVLFEARGLFEQGVSDYLPVLTALTSLSNLERAALQAQRLLLSYRVQLYHALGGTWSKAATKLSN